MITPQSGQISTDAVNPDFNIVQHSIVGTIAPGIIVTILQVLKSTMLKRSIDQHDPIFTDYVNAQTIPDFPTSSILPAFMAVTVFIILYARKRHLSKVRSHNQP